MTLTELQRFCAAEDGDRDNIKKPWTRDGFTWATNGHIMVRVPAMAEVPENPSAPDCLALWNKQPAPKEWFVVPETTMPPDKECEECNGSRIVECNYGHDHECEGCEGRGSNPDTLSSLEIGGSHFAQRYLALIQGWEIAPNGYAAAWLRGDGAEGLLMPMHK